jgi:hypothetical protein
MQSPNNVMNNNDVSVMPVEVAPPVVELPFNPELVMAHALYDLIDEDLSYPYWD